MDDHQALEGAAYLEEFVVLARRWADQGPQPEEEKKIGRLASVIREFAGKVKEDRGRQDLLDAVAELEDAVGTSDPAVRNRRLRAAARFVEAAERAGADRVEPYMAAVVRPNGDVVFVKHSMFRYDTLNLSFAVTEVIGDADAYRTSGSYRLTERPVTRTGLWVMARQDSPHEPNPVVEHMLDSLADADLRAKLKGLRGPVAFLYMPHTAGQTPDTAPFPARLFHQLGAAHHEASLALRGGTGWQLEAAGRAAARPAER